MTAGISLNQFAPNTPIDGMYVYQANLPQLHNVIVSASQSTALAAGAFVTLDTSSTNTNAPVAKQAGVTDKVFGVLTYNPVKNQYGAGERIAIARANDIIFKTAAGEIAVGSDLYFNSSNQVTSTPATGGTKIGVALTPAAAEGDLIQVELHFEKAIAASQLPDLSDTYQTKLTAGDFVSISDENVITTTYTAGSGIAISDEGAISTQG